MGVTVTIPRMRKMIRKKLITAVFFGTAVMSGCAQEASPDKIEKMCANLQKVRNTVTVPSLQEELKKIDDDFKLEQVQIASLFKKTCRFHR